MASLQPVFPDSIYSRAIAMVSGYQFSCALFSNGELKCWGDGNVGHLGSGSTADVGDDAGDMVSLSALNFGDGRTALAITANYDHACAVLNTGQVKC